MSTEPREKKLLEFSCALNKGEHIQGWEIFALLGIIKQGKSAEGWAVKSVRIEFLERRMAEQEKRPLLDIGCHVWFHDDGAATAPAIPGELEFAYWTAPDDCSRVHYSFNSAVFLRVLIFSGRSALRWHAAVSSTLTGLGPREIAALLQSSSRRELPLGLYAAAELSAVGLIAGVEALRIHTDRRVSQTAAQLAGKLALALLSSGAERLAANQRRHPDRSAVFAHLGDAGTRRDTLIWLMRDGHGASPETVKVLRSGLADPDWRVRVTAMFLVARLKLQVLWQGYGR